MNSDAKTSSSLSASCTSSSLRAAPLPTNSVDKNIVSSPSSPQPMTIGQAQKKIEQTIQALGVKQLRRFAKNEKICLFGAKRKSDIQSWILSHLQFELHKCYLGELVKHHHKSIPKPIAKSRK